MLLKKLAFPTLVSALLALGFIGGTVRSPSASGRVYLYPVNNYSKYGFIDSTGRVVIPMKFNMVSKFRNGLAAVNVGGAFYGEHFQGGKWGFIDYSGKFVIGPRFDDARSFKDGFAAVAYALPDSQTSQGFPYLKWGFINKRGHIVIPQNYDDVTDFAEGRAAVMSGQWWGVIDTTGKMIASPAYRWSIQFSDRRAWVQGKNYAWGVMNRNGRLVRPCDLSLKDITGFSEGRSVVQTNANVWLVVDTSGTVLLRLGYQSVSNFHDSLASIIDNGKLGLIDRAGHVVLRTSFQSRRGESESLVVVERNGKWGYADANTWKLVIAASYTDADSFSGGLAPVKPERNGKVGFIDRSGKLVIPPSFLWSSGFDGPLAEVTLSKISLFESRMGYINKKGHVIWRQPGKYGHGR